MNSRIRARRRFLGGCFGLLVFSAMAGPALSDSAGTHSRSTAMSGTWAVMAGAGLKATLERWSDVAGWTLVWDNRSDFRMRASATFEGSFEESVGALIDGIYLNNPGFTATLYRGNKVLHVQEQSLSSN